MTLAILSGLLTFVGLFIGAYLARNRELEKYRKDRITQAYTSFLDAASRNSGLQASMLMSKVISGQQLDDEELAAFEDINARVVNAHSNVVIYGSKEVIGALSDFYNTGGDPRRNPLALQAYIALIQAMRHDSDAEDYPAFGAHVDNILGSGPDRRRAMMAQMLATQMPGAPR